LTTSGKTENAVDTENTFGNTENRVLEIYHKLLIATYIYTAKRNRHSRKDDKLLLFFPKNV